MKLQPATLWRRNTIRKQYLGEFGVVLSFSVVRQAPPQLEKRVPYIVALVQVGDQKVVTQVVDCNPDEIFVDMKVVGVMRRLFDVDADALHVYGVKFAPVKEIE